MENIIGYVKEWGKYSFLEKPFNEVDSLVLCQLVYLNFEKFVPGPDTGSHPVGIQSIYIHPDRDKILDDYWYRENNKELFGAMAASVRFGNIKMNYYVNIIDQEEETQFSAMTYFLGDDMPKEGNVYIAYRGTDATIVGWKEDLNLAFSKPLHGQYLAVEYMDKVAEKIGRGFYAGGHSKGGNLAVYAAMNCKEETREKIRKIFNNDGPGFRPEIRQQGNFQAIEEKVVKFIPRSSLVGMILEGHSEYEIVESWGIGLFQHNTYSWKIEDGALVRAQNMTSAKIRRDNALNEWILSLSEEEIHIFIDTLYEVVSASEASNIFEFGADWKKCLQNIIQAAKGVDDATRKAIHKVTRSLFESLGESIRAGNPVFSVRKKES